MNDIQTTSSANAQLANVRAVLTKLDQDLTLQEKNLQKEIDQLTATSTPPWWQKLLKMEPEKGLAYYEAERTRCSRELRSIRSIKFNIAGIAIAIGGVQLNTGTAKVLGTALMLYASICTDPDVTPEEKKVQWAAVQAALEAVQKESERLSETLLQREEDTTATNKIKEEAEAKSLQEKAKQDEISSQRMNQEREIDMTLKAKQAEIAAQKEKELAEIETNEKKSHAEIAVKKNEEAASLAIEREKMAAEKDREEMRVNMEKKKSEMQIAMNEEKKKSEERIKREVEATRKTQAEADERAARARQAEAETEYQRKGVFGKVGSFFAGK
ncbi:MAG: hypothetical protein LBI69_03810 [Puniceicoccales bacterium]|nr:hypothetical protein [Puniceicoccales bacterium]